MANVQWFLPTNTKNLSMMLSQGLITEPAGCEKYYDDVLNKYPGYMPVTKSNDVNTIGEAIKLSLKERAGLIPCIISIDLKVIIEGTFYLANEIQIKSSDIASMDESITTLYIPLPLPLQCISKVFLKNTEDKDKYKNDIKTLYGNVSSSFFKFETLALINKSMSDINKKGSELAFSTQEVAISQENNNLLPQRNKIDYSKVYAISGVLGVLFYLTKNGGKSEDYFLDFCKLECEANTLHDSDFKLIKKYFFSVGVTTLDNNPLTKMFYPILDIMIKDEVIKDPIINSLKNNGLEGSSLIRSSEIASFLTDYSRNKITKRVSDIFEELNKPNKSKIEMILFMLFHKDSIDNFLKYNLDIFEEVDYILFAILFGMKGKYVNLPSFLKEYNGLQTYLSNMMASYAHQLSNSDIRFKEVKPPLTLNKMLNPKKVGLIHWLSEQLDLQSCFKSIMPNKIYTNNSGESTYEGIVLPRFEKIETEYFKVMSKKEVDDKLYNQILEKYKKAI